MKFLMYNLASISCVIGAAFLALSGKDGWGWFLLVGLMLHTTEKQSKSQPNTKANLGETK